ncbi:MAG: glycosyltransferase [Ramlibacter sp.]
MRQEFADLSAEPGLSPLSIPGPRTDLTPTPLRVLALSASSGGGHDGTAQALRQLLESAHPGGIQWQCLDVYDRGLRLLPWLARVRHHTFGGWALFTRVTEWPWVLRMARWALVERLVHSVLARVDPWPDLLIATHFAAAQILDTVASRLPRRPITVIVASDYSPHRAWFAKADALIVSHDPGQARARQFMGDSQRIISSTLLPCLPATPRGSRTRTDRHVRMLVVMGAEGTSGNQLIHLLRALSIRPWSALLDIEIICGRNERLQEKLRALNVGQVTGYVTDLPQRLAEADICLLRASPLVMTEALAAGTAVLAFDWHAHEAANAYLIEQWECGRASKSIPELVNILQDWTERPGQLASVQTAARKLATQTLQVCAIRPLVEEAARARCLS